MYGYALNSNAIKHGFRDFKAIMETEGIENQNGSTNARAEEIDGPTRRRMGRRHSAPSVSRFSFDFHAMQQAAAAAAAAVQAEEAQSGATNINTPEPPRIEIVIPPPLTVSGVNKVRVPRRASLNAFTNYEALHVPHEDRISHTLQSFETDAFDDALASVEDIDMGDMDPLDLDDSFSFDDNGFGQQKEEISKQELPQDISFTQDINENIVRQNAMDGAHNDPLLELLNQTKSSDAVSMYAAAV